MLKIEWNYLVNWLVLDSSLSLGFCTATEGGTHHSLLPVACDEFLTHFPKEQDY